MYEGEAADRPEPGLARSAQVPPTATSVAWSEVWDPTGIAHRYGVVGALLGAGIDAARIQVFHDPESGGAYWVVALGGGRLAVLTDDTEEHAGHLEGPWPFKAVFLSPDRVRTEIAHSINDLTAQTVTWCTEALAPRAAPAEGEGPDVRRRLLRLHRGRCRLECHAAGTRGVRRLWGPVPAGEHRTVHRMHEVHLLRLRRPRVLRRRDSLTCAVGGPGVARGMLY